VVLWVGLRVGAGLAGSHDGRHELRCVSCRAVCAVLCVQPQVVGGDAALDPMMGAMSSGACCCVSAVLLRCYAVAVLCVCCAIAVLCCCGVVCLLCYGGVVCLLCYCGVVCLLCYCGWE